jgi:hypothetical protein
MVDDPIEELRRFLDEWWAVVQRTLARFQDCAELRVLLEEVTPNEAVWFIAAVNPHDGEPPLFTIADDNKHLSDRYPPNADLDRRDDRAVFGEELPTLDHLRFRP